MNVAWRYALAVVSVAHALAVGLLLASYNFATIEFPVFFFALAVTARYGWYGGTGPAILGLLRATFAFIYFFTEPRYSFYVTSGDVAILRGLHSVCGTDHLVQLSPQER